MRVGALRRLSPDRPRMPPTLPCRWQVLCAEGINERSLGNLDTSSASTPVGTSARTAPILSALPTVHLYLEISAVPAYHELSYVYRI